MFCLDTGIVIAMLRGEPALKQKFLEISRVNELFITFITLCELYKGAYLSKNLEYELNIIEAFLGSVRIVGFNKTICQDFGKEYVILQKSGKKTSEFDLMIAVIAKAHGTPIVTRNKKDFIKMDIKVEEW